MYDYVMINPWAVVLAAVINMLVGFVWYSTGMGFGKTWIKLVGLTEKKIKEGNPGRAMGIALIASLVEAVTLAFVLSIASVQTVKEGMYIAFVLWLFAIAIMFMHFLFENRSMKLFWIYAGQNLVSVLLMGAVIAGW